MSSLSCGNCDPWHFANQKHIKCCDSELWTYLEMKLKNGDFSSSDEAFHHFRKLFHCHWAEINKLIKSANESWKNVS